MTEAELSKRLKTKYGNVKTGSAGHFYFPCPTCNPGDSKKMRRWASVYSPISKCWICNRVIPTAFLLDQTQFDTVERPAEIEKSKDNPFAREIPATRVIPIHKLPPEHSAVKFLAKDHLFDLERYYIDYGIVFCPSDGGVIIRRSEPFVSSAERLIFPVMYERERVGWQIRSIPGTVYGDRPDCMRYCHMFNKGKYLYNYDQARNYPLVVLVEGVKKALKFPNYGVASLGKNVTPAQQMLLQHWKNVVVMLDGDEESQYTARAIATNINIGGASRALNINLSDYNIPSPDESTTEILEAIVYYEWTRKFGTYQST